MIVITTEQSQDLRGSADQPSIRPPIYNNPFGRLRKFADESGINESGAEQQ